MSCDRADADEILDAEMLWETNLRAAATDRDEETLVEMVGWAAMMVAEGELLLLVTRLLETGDPDRWSAAIAALEALVAEPDDLELVEPEPTPAMPLLLLVEPS